ncbi:uncharacterized protein TM35_000341670 [Trypanosoma theileri]|uniref:Uncharacterized protein n=1 Tax=Trypanosoma theileri TaxID=67003 RepID=A0A1X0NLH1_9TRYP|nr:uncharacterized protein TM35_000341670 [Trypanosoma theileri]ORC85555.1 hypothetical protein TM35_000341670 [Trypanosoma theileri]
MGYRASLLPSGTNILPFVPIFLYFAAIVFSWVNYGVFFRNRVSVYGLSLVGAHLAFCIVGTVFYVIVSSVLWVRAARYTNKSSQRIRFILLGISGMFFMKDIPLFVVECVATVQSGWLSGYQGFCFVVQFCFFLLSLIITWLSFIWLITTFIECHWGRTDMQERRSLGKALSYPVPAPVPPPPIMIQEEPYGRNTDPGFLVQVNSPRQVSGSRDQNKSRISLDQWKDPNAYI